MGSYRSPPIHSRARALGAVWTSPRFNAGKPAPNRLREPHRGGACSRAPHNQHSLTVIKVAYFASMEPFLCAAGRIRLAFS